MDEWVLNIKYKPSFSFGLYQCIWDKTPCLRVSMLVPDVKDPTKNLIVHHERFFINPVTESEFYQAAYEIVEHLEIHEIKEQFSVMGKQLHNPHPGINQ